MSKRLLLLVTLVAGFAAGAQSQGGNKVGYADTGYILSQLPDMKAIEADLQSTQKQLRNEIDAKSQEVQKQYDAFTANAEGMVDTVRASRQRELEAALAELEQMQQDAQRTLQNKQKLYMAPLYLRVNRVIQEVAQENGYAIILTDKVSDYDLLLYRDKQNDISDLVLQKFGVTPEVK